MNTGALKPQAPTMLDLHNLKSCLASLELCLKERRGSKGCTHSLSTSATVHLYCAVEKRQMSANCRTVEGREGVRLGSGSNIWEFQTFASALKLP